MNECVDCGKDLSEKEDYYCDECLSNAMAALFKR